MPSIAASYRARAVRRYAHGVKTVEEIRLEKYRQLLTELEPRPGVPPSQAEVARALGISAVYVHQLEHGKRVNIDSKSARKMELAMDKPIGWMDNDPDLWPFEAVTAERFSKLTERQKGMAEQELRRIVEEAERARGALGGASGGAQSDQPKAA